MKKTILTVTLIAALAIMPTIGCMAAQNDSPNDKARYKQTSVLLNEKLEPKCKCEKETCPKEENEIKKECKGSRKEEKMKKENETKQQEEKMKKESEAKQQEDKTKKQICPR